MFTCKQNDNSVANPSQLFVERFQQSSNACLKLFCGWLPSGDSFSLIMIFYTQAFSKFWQQRVMVCCIWLCVLVIQDLCYINIVCVVGSKRRIYLVCRGREWDFDQNLLFLFELKKKKNILCVFKMAGDFWFFQPGVA